MHTVEMICMICIVSNYAWQQTYLVGEINLILFYMDDIIKVNPCLRNDPRWRK